MEEYYNYKKFDYSQLYKKKNIDEKFYLLLNEYFSRRLVEMDFSEEELKQDVEHTMSKLNGIKLKKHLNKNSLVAGYYGVLTKNISLYADSCDEYSLFARLCHELGHVNNNLQLFKKKESYKHADREEGKVPRGFDEKLGNLVTNFIKGVERSKLWSLPFVEICTEHKAYRINSPDSDEYGFEEVISTDVYEHITPIMVIMSSISDESIKELLKKSEKGNEPFEKIVLDMCDNKEKAQYYIDSMAANVFLLNSSKYFTTKEESDVNFGNSLYQIQKASMGILVERMKTQLPSVKEEEFPKYMEKIKFAINSVNINLKECDSIEFFEYNNSDLVFSNCGTYIKMVVEKLENVEDISMLSDKEELDKIFTVTNKELEEFKDDYENNPDCDVEKYYSISDETREECLKLKRINKYDNSQIVEYIKSNFVLGDAARENKILNFFKRKKKEPLSLNEILMIELKKKRLTVDLQDLVNDPAKIQETELGRENTTNKISQTKDER